MRRHRSLARDQPRTAPGGLARRVRRPGWCRARRRRPHVSGVPVFAAVEALLRHEEVELVSICTPPAAHARLIEAAAAAGKHVLVEKPMAMTVADADRALAACRANGVHLGVVHQQRAQASTQALHRLCASGAFGVPLLAAVSHTWYKNQAQVDRDAWRADAATGGGVLLDQAVHDTCWSGSSARRRG